MRCRLVMQRGRVVGMEKGCRKIQCSFLNNISLELCDEEFDSTVDESNKVTELEEEDEGEEEGTVEVVQRACSGVVENVEAVEVGQSGGVS